MGFEHVEVPYPTVENGVHAAQHLGNWALGKEQIPVSELVAYAWILAGAGLGYVLPPDVTHSSEFCPCPEELKAKLANLTGEHGATAIDWKGWAVLALQVLLELLQKTA